MATSINGIRNADDYLAEVVNRQVVELVSDKITAKLPAGFQNSNKNLVKVDLPLVTELSESTFSACPNLSSVNLPALTKMAASNFGSCGKLKKICLPELTTWVGYGYGFNNGNVLEKVVLPKLTSQIGPYDFNGCKTLTALVLGANTVVPLTNANAFTSSAIKNGTGYIYVPAAQLEAYKAATNWSTLATQFRAIEDYPGIMEV
jgi:hypothetical protein